MSTVIDIKDISPIHERMIDWRHDFHQHPELAFQEVRTSQKVAAYLKEFGLKVQTGIAKTGVVATLENGDGPTIALRTDMDALPILEENRFAYASKTSGLMHACGHDGHMSMLLGAARYLTETKAFQGKVHFIFQPAEENEAGAKAMIEDGLFDQFDCDAVFGLHNWPGLDVGGIELCAGPIMAAFDIFDITIKGQGAHAALPQMGQDTLLSASQLISSLQSIVSRRVNPISPAVVSVTKLSGGDAYNILPSLVTLAGCTRHFDRETQDQIESQIHKICQGVAVCNDVEIVVDYQRRYPVTVNTVQETTIASTAAGRTVGEANINTDCTPSLGSEDFAFMLEERPGCYIRLGNGPSDHGRILHSPAYDFCDDALVYGAAYWSNLVPAAFDAIRQRGGPRA